MAEKKEYKVLEHLTFQTDIKKLKLNVDIEMNPFIQVIKSCLQNE